MSSLCDRHRQASKPSAEPSATAITTACYNLLFDCANEPPQLWASVCLILFHETNGNIHYTALHCICSTAANNYQQQTLCRFTSKQYIDILFFIIVMRQAQWISVQSQNFTTTARLQATTQGFYFDRLSIQIPSCYYTVWKACKALVCVCCEQA